MEHKDSCILSPVNNPDFTGEVHVTDDYLEVDDWDRVKVIITADGKIKTHHENEENGDYRDCEYDLDCCPFCGVKFG